MKKQKTNPKQIIAGTLASIIFLQSCSKQPITYYDEEDVTVINMLYDDYNRSEIIPIQINLDKEICLYMDFLRKLINDIIYDPQIAQTFLNSPKDYIESNGFDNVEINLDDELIEFITCFADKDLNVAITKNDVEGFIRICSEKGYFNRLKRPEVDNIRKILQSNPELQKQICPENASFVAFALAVVVGVAAFVWAITVTHVTAGNVVAVGTFHVYAAATTWSWKINHSITPNHDYLTQNNATIDIWLLKSNDLSNLGIIIDKKLICI